MTGFPRDRLVAAGVSTPQPGAGAALDQRVPAEAALDTAWGAVCGFLTEDPLVEEWCWEIVTQSRQDLVGPGERGGPRDSGQVYLHALGEVVPVSPDALTRKGLRALLGFFPTALPTTECVRCRTVGCVGVTAVTFTSTRLVLLTFCSTCNRQMFDLANATGPWAWGRIWPDDSRGGYRCS